MKTCQLPPVNSRTYPTSHLSTFQLSDFPQLPPPTCQLSDFPTSQLSNFPTVGLSPNSHLRPVNSPT
ncbi:hypothetical protein [Limnospira fusiformis]|uniref:Uncharacterized protein n=1 Tax=Limnospira fusiformis PMC 851.14 TaxID=2219512 RepID=A0ABU9EJN8_LIMFS